MQIENQLELYLHIPFCVRKCKYCDFFSGPSTKEERKAYKDELIEEIKRRSCETKVSTIFVGGGTPTCLEVEWMGEIFEVLRAYYTICDDAEISMEMNPGTVSKASLQAYKEMGINRLSIGLQSSLNKELKLLGRIHTWEEFLTCYQWVRETGFNNVNIDLMSGLPGQTLNDWTKTLEQVVALNPEHISAYSLIIEEGTPFYDLYKDFENEEVDRQIYHYTKAYLKEKGYERYEISNYAKSGYECRHNSSYWTGIPYMGFGQSASSYECVDGQWIRSTNGEEREVLTNRERMEEFMFLGLRMIKGVTTTEFEYRFGCSIESVYGNILRKLQNEGLLEWSNHKIYLTEYGLDVSNYVFEKFLL
ncbi:putative coproporphyrinogen III oxidase [Lachnospiraceae bacterium TWA4]|nr:putative coproporphyrinogen III oxidase [Lachnospiraceae bacterium TWA4]